MRKSSSVVKEPANGERRTASGAEKTPSTVALVPIRNYSDKRSFPFAVRRSPFAVLIALSVALTALIALGAAGAFAQSDSQPGFQAEVLKVVDGDTIKIRRVGYREITLLRLIGLDAPEVSTRETEGQEPYGIYAQQYLSVAITRKIIRIEQDVQRENNRGELLGYVWLGNRLMNAEMLSKGLVTLATEPPNVKYVEQFQRSQSEARNQSRGIWDEKAPLAVSPREYREGKRKAVVKQAQLEASFELPDFEEGCIIGNRKTKKYHLPTGKFYESAKESKNKVFFKTADDAEKAGYVPSAR